MECIGRLPGAIAHARHVLAGQAGSMQRQAVAVAGDDVTNVIQPLDLDLQALDRAVDIAHGAAAARFLAQDMPGFEGMAQLELDAALGDATDQREAELEMRREPVGLKAIAGGAEIVEHVGEVLPHEMRQHEIVVQARAPAAQPLLVGAIPEGSDQATQQGLLGHAHAPVRRHLEGAQLEEPAPAGSAVRREELVDAELGAVRVARGVDQDVAKDAVDQPGRRRLTGLDLAEGDLELVQRIVARLVDARMLAGRANEQAGEEVGKRRMVEPVA